MTTTVTAQTRYQPHCPVCEAVPDLLREELERERDKFEAWGSLMRHLQVAHQEVVEEVPITRTVIEQDVPVADRQKE